jgi:hypothetical protein
LSGADGLLRDRRADRPDDPLRARRRRPPVRLAQGRPLRRPRFGVHRSDRRSRSGKLTRQGSPQLRWALYESAQAACRPTSPDRADYLELKQRGLSHTRASLTISRKLARRCFHSLRELGPEALEPVTEPSSPTVPPSSPLPRWQPTFRPAPAAFATLAHRRRSTKDRAAGVVPRGTTHRPSRRRPKGRAPR